MAAAPSPVALGGATRGSERRHEDRGETLGRKAQAEGGSALLDVVVAVVVLLVVLLPVAGLMRNAGGVVGTERATATADALASGQIDQLLASQPVMATSGTFPPPGVTAGAFPASPTATAAVGGVTYDIYEAGGWCGVTGSPPGVSGTGGTYVVVAYVTWGTGASHARLTSEIPTPPGYSGPESASCPTGLANP